MGTPPQDDPRYVCHAPDGLRAIAATGLGCVQAGAQKLGVIEASYASATIGELARKDELTPRALTPRALALIGRQSKLTRGGFPRARFTLRRDEWLSRVKQSCSSRARSRPVPGFPSH